MIEALNKPHLSARPRGHCQHDDVDDLPSAPDVQLTGGVPNDFDPLDFGGGNAIQLILRRVVFSRDSLPVDENVASGAQTSVTATPITPEDIDARYAVQHVAGSDWVVLVKKPRLVDNGRIRRAGIH